VIKDIVRPSNIKRLIVMVAGKFKNLLLSNMKRKQEKEEESEDEIDFK